MRKEILQKGAVTLQQLIIAFGLTVGTAIWLTTSNCVLPDRDTGLTCQELLANPEQDIYYVVKVSDVEPNQGKYSNAHENFSSARRNEAGDKMILKFDADEVPDDVDLGEPYSHTEILEYLNDPVNGFVEEEEIVKEQNPRNFATDDNFITQ